MRGGRWALPMLAALACSAGASSDGGGGATGAGGRCEEPPPCRATFHYPLGAETQVELFGDFSPTGWDEGIPMQIDAGEWRTSIPANDGQTIRYKFRIDGETWVPDPANPDQEDDGLGGLQSVEHVSCEGTPCILGDGGSGAGDPAPGEFDWRSAVLYFVFVDRFKNGDTTNDVLVDGVEKPANYQGGDYAGLLEVIESGYFDDLGVNALWLTVPMDNPSVAGAGADGHPYSAYHGYWPADWKKVEEHFGDMDLLKQVVDAAHARGIKVLFDYAMNHVHIDNPLYTEHPDWFWPLDYEGRYCVCGDGCGWDGYEGRRCWFRDYLPDWNYQNVEARAASVDNAIWWIQKTGADGYRLDAVKHIETTWIEDLRERVDAEIDQTRGRFYMVGETFDTGNRDVIRQYVGPTLLDGQFDFPLRGAIVEHILRRGGTMFDLDGFLATNDGYYPGIMSTFIGNHDIARVIQTALDEPWGAWDNGGNANWASPPAAPASRAPFERVGLGFAFLFTTRGIPLVYYGDEIGMPGAGDPDNRRMMQLEDLDENQAWLLQRVQALGKIRKAHPALYRGARSTVFVSDDVYAYRMTDGDETLYVALNRGDAPQAVEGLPAAGTDLLTDDAVVGPSVELAPRSVVIVEP